MTYVGLKVWLQRTIGLDVATVGPLAVERAVQSRMTACQLQDLTEYTELLCGSTIEQQQLIEGLVVRETFFFRDRQAFASLVSLFDAAWLHAHSEVLRLLCLPCASGEEAYSMAMALLDAGFPASRLHIDAIDISQTALDRAQRGIYGNHSFRGTELAYREPHFKQLGDKWQLSDTIRQTVHFRLGNVLALGMEHVANYHAIFCRNLLIYFDKATQLRTVTTLSGGLREDGVLFVGPSEAGLLLSMGFVPARLPMSFAFRMPVATQRVPVHGQTTGPDGVITLPRMSSVVAPAAVVAIKNSPAPARTAAVAASMTEPPPDLEAAERLADSGRLEEAAAACAAHVQAHGLSARSLYLLGLVQGAKGDERRAEASFRQALYLQPDHAQALAHLALLLDAKGDAAGARRLRQRSRRGQGGGS